MRELSGYRTPLVRLIEVVDTADCLPRKLVIDSSKAVRYDEETRIILNGSTAKDVVPRAELLLTVESNSIHAEMSNKTFFMLIPGL